VINMIQLFDIKKNNKKLKLQDNELLNKYAEMSKKNNEEILKYTNSNVKGLNKKQAEELLIENGPNIVVKNEKKSRFYFLFNSFKDKFIIILLILAVINYILSDAISTYIILGIASKIIVYINLIRN